MLTSPSSLVLPPYDDLEEEKRDIIDDRDELTNEFSLNNKFTRSVEQNVPDWDDLLDIPKPDWKDYDISNFFFFAVLTHEARSSLSNEIFIPFARMNDCKLYVASLGHLSKFGSLGFLGRLQNGNHINMREFHVREATEVEIEPVTNSFFNIDGEIYPSDEVYVKLLPSYLRLIGNVDEVPDELHKARHMLLNR